jgi:hypothetical protein
VAPRRLAVLCLASPLTLIGPPAHAGGGARAGFAMQALLGGAVPLVSAPGGGTAPAGPTLRVGVSSPAILAAASVSYLGMSDPAGTGGLHSLTAGMDLLPYAWHHRDGRARLYLLFGGNVGVSIQAAQPAHGEAGPGHALSGGFSVGIGGQYFLHPGYALGVEIGARTQLWRPEGTLGASAGLYGALSGTFVAGGG